MDTFNKAKALLESIGFKPDNDLHEKLSRELVAQALITAWLDGKIAAAAEIKALHDEAVAKQGGSI